MRRVSTFALGAGHAIERGRCTRCGIAANQGLVRYICRVGLVYDTTQPQGVFDFGMARFVGELGNENEV